MRLVLLLWALARPAWAADEFLRNLRQAERLGGLEEKIEYLSRAIRAWTPSHGNSLLSHCHFRRGQARYESAQFPAAETDLAKSVSLDPRNSQAYLLLGRIQMRLGHWRQAARFLKESTALDPANFEAWLNLADSYREDGRYKPAARAYAKAREGLGEDFRPDLGLAKISLSRRDWMEAESLIERAQARSRRRLPEILETKSALQAARGENDKAAQDLRQAVELRLRQIQDLNRARASPAQIEDSRRGLSEDCRRARQWGDSEACAQTQEGHVR